MRYLLIILFLVISLNANAESFYVRPDGGAQGTECDGTVDQPKDLITKRCAFNSFYAQMTFSLNKSDSITISGGTYIVSIQPPPIWIPVSTFYTQPSFYINAIKKGRRVYFNELGGVAYELILKKY